MAGAVGEASSGVETLREASAPCCVRGNFFLSFDNVFVLDVDMSNEEHTTSEYFEEALKEAMDQGE